MVGRKTIKEHMSHVLTTFSGKAGEILWSLPTVREISRRLNCPVDLGIMPAYRGLLNLLNSQSYIDVAFCIEDWVCTGSPYGDQPWESPVPANRYTHVAHLTYRQHPGIGCPAIPLAAFTAWQQGITLPSPVRPFIAVDGVDVIFERPVVPYAFNPMYAEQKSAFLTQLEERSPDLDFVDVSRFPWLSAASIVKKAGVFVGCRSACWVMAIGVGTPTITFEPHPSRNAAGQLGVVFGPPQGGELALCAYNSFEAAEAATHAIRQLAVTN
jgi:hypothetical protein